MVRKRCFLSDGDFPSDLSILTDADLHQLAGQMQEEVLRDFDSPLGLLREITLMRSALVDLELAFRRGEGARIRYLR
jgi:hypothetical protein